MAHNSRLTQSPYGTDCVNTATDGCTNAIMTKKTRIASFTESKLRLNPEVNVGDYLPLRCKYSDTSSNIQ